MLPTSGPLPADPEGWAWEPKWDGMRALLVVGDRVQMVSRNGRHHEASFPELAGLVDALGRRRVVLDGEVVIGGDDGRPDWDRLRHRLGVTDPARVQRARREHPATFVAFDVLAADGVSLCASSYAERRSALVSLGLAGPSWVTTPSWVGAVELHEVTAAFDLEGVVAKRLDSRYRPGQRSTQWIKCKHHRDRLWLRYHWGRRG